MTKFFMPNYNENEALNEIIRLKIKYKSISDKNILSITYKRNSEYMTDTVGHKNVENNERIIAIIEAESLFYTITLNERNNRVSAMMLSKDDVRVTYFED